MSALNICSEYRNHNVRCFGDPWEHLHDPCTFVLCNLAAGV